MLNKVSLNTARKYVVACLRAGVFPYVAGSPACGKSKMIESVFKEFNLKPIDIRLSQEDPTCINGALSINGDRSRYLPPERLPLQGIDNLPLLEKYSHYEEEYLSILKQGNEAHIKQFQNKHCYKGWGVLFDELPSAPESVRAAAYKIILDRMIDTHKIHSKCVMCGAGNFVTDDAIAEEMGTALKSRMSHIHVEGDPKEYLNLITSKEFNFDSRIVSYLSYAQDKINTFKKFQQHSSDETFASQRTWEFVNKLLKANCPKQDEPISDEWTDLFCGTIGSTAHEFVQFTYAFKDLPKFEDIKADPTNTKLPVEPAVMWLLVGMLVSSSTVKNVDPIITYINRLPKEFQFIFVRMLVNKADEFLDVASVVAVWESVADMMMQ